MRRFLFALLLVASPVFAQETTTTNVNTDNDTDITSTTTATANNTNINIEAQGSGEFDFTIDLDSRPIDETLAIITVISGRYMRAWRILQNTKWPCKTS